MLRLLLVASLIAPAGARGVEPVPQDGPYTQPGPVPEDSPHTPPRPVPEDSPHTPPGPVPEDSPYTPPGPVPEDSPSTASPPDQPASRPADLERTAPTLRLGFGAAFAPAPMASIVTGFNFDVAVGAVVHVHKHVFLWPELGYNYTGRGARAGHFFVVGLTPMFGQRLVQVGLAPRLVVGDAFGRAGVGLRSGLLVSVGLQLLTVELGHQWVRAGGRDLHDGRFMISVDMLMLTKAAAALILAGGIVRALR